MSDALSNWLERHQHPVSRGLHFVAIPVLLVAGALAIFQIAGGAWDLWWRPAGLLFVSYALQWVGHVIEGNDMGEVVLVKKWLGRPYVAIAPQYRRDRGTASVRESTAEGS